MCICMRICMRMCTHIHLYPFLSVRVQIRGKSLRMERDIRTESLEEDKLKKEKKDKGHPAPSDEST